jgi:hypothetical protein
MPVKNPKELFVLLLSHARQGTERTGENAMSIFDSKRACLWGARTFRTTAKRWRWGHSGWVCGGRSEKQTRHRHSESTFSCCFLSNGRMNRSVMFCEV